MPVRRRQTGSLERVLTPEVIEAILAKEALLRAGVPPIGGRIINSTAPVRYVILQAHGVTDSATFVFRGAEDDSSFLTMLATESVLRREWDSPEEDEAWADL